MKVVYLAGPFRGPTHWDIRQNVLMAEHFALQVWLAGAACICPHLNSQNFHGQGPDELWLDGYLELVRRSDAVFGITGWNESTGALAEVALCRRLGKPVFDEMHLLREWIR